MNDEILLKLQKLLALAQQGEGGEAINAQALLERMMVKYGITDADLVNGVQKTLRYATEDQIEYELLVCIISHVCQIELSEALTKLDHANYSGVDVTLNLEDHGLVASLFEHYQIGLAQAYQSHKESYLSKVETLKDRIKSLNSEVRDIKRILGNVDVYQEKVRRAILCAFVNINGLTGHIGGDDAETDEVTDQAIMEAFEYVDIMPNPNQLPAQRLN